MSYIPLKLYQLLVNLLRKNILGTSFDIGKMGDGTIAPPTSHIMIMVKTTKNAITHLIVEIAPQIFKPNMTFYRKYSSICEIYHSIEISSESLYDNSLPYDLNR